MNKLIASATLLALLAVGRGAGAAEATGWITYLDRETDRIVLDDGRIFGVSEDINFSTLSDGVRVRVLYDAIGGDRIVTEILPAPEAPRPSKAAAPQTAKTTPVCTLDRQENQARTRSVPLNAIC